MYKLGLTEEKEISIDEVNINVSTENNNLSSNVNHISSNKKNKNYIAYLNHERTMAIHNTGGKLIWKFTDYIYLRCFSHGYQLMVHRSNKI